MAVGRSGSVVKTSLGFLIFGAQGTWKSSLASELIKYKNEDGNPFRVLFIDAEQGSINSYLQDYELQGIDLRNLYLIYTQSLTEVRGIVKKVKNNEDIHTYDENGEETDDVYMDADGKPFRADAVVVDGGTLLFIARQQGLTEFSKLRATVRARQKEMTGLEKQVSIQGAGLELKDYNTLKFDGQGLVLDLLATGKHFAITCREDDEKISTKLSDGSFQSIPTGKKIPQGFKDVRYNVKTVIHTIMGEDGKVSAIVEDKDRTMIHKQNEVLPHPTLMDWQPVISMNKGKKEFLGKNTMGDAVTTELKNSNETDMVFEKAILSSEIDALSTVEDYQGFIGKKLKELQPEEQTARRKAVESAKLPTKFREVTDVEVLKKILKVVVG